MKLFKKITKDIILVRLIWITLSIKLSIILIIIFGFNLLPFCKECHDLNFIYPAGEKINLTVSFKTWDGQHYLYLADKGYQPNREDNAFYPLYPLLIRWLKIFFFNNSLITALALSNLLSFLAVILFYLLVKKIYDSRIAFYSGIFMLSFPTAFYMALPYGESLFLALIISFFYFLYQKKLLAAALSLFFLPISRDQGLLVFVPLLFFLFGKNNKKGQIQVVKGSLLLVIFGLGVATYFGFMFFSTGSIFSGFTAHKSFVGGNSVTNLLDPLKWLLRNFIFIKFTFHGFTTSLIDRAFFFLFLPLLWFIYKSLNKEFYSYALVMGLVPAFSDTFMAYTRHLLLVFPIFIILALKLKEKSIYAIIPMLACQAVFLLAHSLNYWIA